jgi:hypothetical protein
LKIFGRYHPDDTLLQVGITLEWVDEFLRMGIVGDRIYCKVPPPQISFQTVAFLLSQINGCLLEYHSRNLAIGIEYHKSSVVLMS